MQIVQKFVKIEQQVKIDFFFWKSSVDYIKNLSTNES
jgi:hypothetical protein